MQKVQIITGRISSLSYDFASQNNIAIIPVNIIMGEKTMKDDNDKKAKEFLEKLPTLEEIPSTAVPSHGEMLEIFRKATEKIKKAIHVATSTKLSAICDRGKAAAKDLVKEGRDIRVFDSQTTISMQGMYAYEAACLAKSGKDIDEIINQLKMLRDERRIIEYGVINTLKYLAKNGRIGKAKAWLANLFSFKPIISAKDGELEPVAKVRTNAQALELIINKIKEEMERTKATKIKVMYDYGLSDEYLRSEVDPRIQKEFDAEIVSFNQISTAIACHLGPEVWGVCFKMEN